VLVRALADIIPGVRVTGASAGLHLVVLLGSLEGGADPAAIQRRALARGVRVANLDTYRAASTGEPGLVLGYGNIADHQIRPAVTLLME
jgi:GntR family transcriptional regulator/MocR family aminotransferase